MPYEWQHYYIRIIIIHYILSIFDTQLFQFKFIAILHTYMWCNTRWLVVRKFLLKKNFFFIFKTLYSVVVNRLFIDVHSHCSINRCWISFKPLEKNEKNSFENLFLQFDAKHLKIQLKSFQIELLELWLWEEKIRGKENTTKSNERRRNTHLRIQFHHGNNKGKPIWIIY